MSSPGGAGKPTASIGVHARIASEVRRQAAAAAAAADSSASWRDEDEHGVEVATDGWTEVSKIKTRTKKTAGAGAAPPPQPPEDYDHDYDFEQGEY